MTGRLSFNKYYFVLAIAVLLIEIVIALFIRDRFIRPYLGDVLVVILVYCSIKTIINLRPFVAALISFLFACLVETGQYFNLVQILGLENNQLASIIIGNSFSWEDIVAYGAGALIIWCVDVKYKAAINN